jgi:hypothetical protein
VRGTPHSQAILPLLEQHQVPLIAPSTGATIFHEPVNRYVFNVRTPYRLEAEKLVKLLQTTGVTRIGVLHVGDGFGKDVLAGLQKGFAGAGCSRCWCGVRPRHGHQGHDGLHGAGPAGPGEERRPGVRRGGAGLAVKNAVTACARAAPGAHRHRSNNASTGFIKLLGPNADGVIVSQVFPNERTASTPLVREALNLATQQKLE